MSMGHKGLSHNGHGALLARIMHKEDNNVRQNGHKTQWNGSNERKK